MDENKIFCINDIINDNEDEDYEGFELFKKYFFNLWW